jgi:hypothetical protein
MAPMSFGSALRNRTFVESQHMSGGLPEREEAFEHGECDLTATRGILAWLAARYLIAAICQKILFGKIQTALLRHSTLPPHFLSIF